MDLHLRADADGYPDEDDTLTVLPHTINIPSDLLVIYDLTTQSTAAINIISRYGLAVFQSPQE